MIPGWLRSGRVATRLPDYCTDVSGPVNWKSNQARQAIRAQQASAPTRLSDFDTVVGADRSVCPPQSPTLPRINPRPDTQNVFKQTHCIQCYVLSIRLFVSAFVYFVTLVIRVIRDTIRAIRDYYLAPNRSYATHPHEYPSFRESLRVPCAFAREASPFAQRPTHGV